MEALVEVDVATKAQMMVDKLMPILTSAKRNEGWAVVEPEKLTLYLAGEPAPILDEMAMLRSLELAVDCEVEILALSSLGKISLLQLQARGIPLGV